MQSLTQNLDLQECKNIALKVISAEVNITQAAAQNNTTRKFIRHQKNKALAAIDDKFTAKDPDILFHLPVTKAWIEQFVLASIMCCVI